MKEGWEYKKLGDLGTFVRGGNFSKKDFVENGFPCIHYGQIHMKFGIETFKHISSVPAGMVKPDRCAHKGDLVIAITSEDDAGSCKCTAWMGDYDVYVGGHTAIYRHTMQPKYVSYYFMSPYFQKDKLEYTHGFKVVEISPKDIAKITIPVPPLSEQQSIVDYLDSAFAKIDAMKSNAEKALNEAKALFQASLKEMLEPKEGWEEKKLIKEFSLKSGENLSAKNQVIGPYPVYGGNGITGYHNQYNLSGDQILIGRVGALCGNIHYIKERIWVTDNAFVVNNISSSWNMLFLSYELEYINLNQYASQTAQPVISNKSMKDVSIFQPPLSEQQSIVTTLDSLKSKVDCLQENYDKISQECDALKQAILRQVFE